MGGEGEGQEAEWLRLCMLRQGDGPAAGSANRCCCGCGGWVAAAAQPLQHHRLPPSAALRRAVLCRGGFFEGDDDFCQALVDGGCVKALQLQLARDVEGAQFVEALEEALQDCGS